MKKVFLELGGKSANIVLDDVDDPGGAIGVSAIGVCTHAGQGCAITTRLLLPRSRYDDWLALADQMMESVTYGDPWDPANLQGPLINARQRERVLGYIESGVSRGRDACSRRGRSPPTCRRVTSSSRPSSPTSTRAPRSPRRRSSARSSV